MRKSTEYLIIDGVVGTLALDALSFFAVENCMLQHVLFIWMVKFYQKQWVI
jgi:hypothetical protein